MSVFFFLVILRLFFFFFNDTATTEIYTLSLHDALPICMLAATAIGIFFIPAVFYVVERFSGAGKERATADRKSTRLNSSHSQISYAVFCLKKKKKEREVLTLMAYRRCGNVLYTLGTLAG